MEKSLGQKIVIVNQPGASGSIGTKNALEAPKDGYTWTAGAAKDLGTYAVSCLLDTKIADWNLYLSVVNVSVLGVGLLVGTPLTLLIIPALQVLGAPRRVRRRIEWKQDGSDRMRIR